METYRIEEGVPLYYVTFTVIRWLPVFVAEEPCRLLCESLNFCHQKKALRTNAFVIMSTHVHLIVFDAEFDNQRLRNTLTAMRQFTGRKLADYCEAKMPKVYGQLINAPLRTLHPLPSTQNIHQTNLNPPTSQSGYSQHQPDRRVRYGIGRVVVNRRWGRVVRRDADHSVLTGKAFP